MRSSSISPSVHSCSGYRAESVVDLIFNAGLQSVIDFPTFNYCRNSKGKMKHAAIDWILASSMLAHSISATENLALESRNEHISIDIYQCDIKSTIVNSLDLNSDTGIEKSYKLLDCELDLLKLSSTQQDPNCLIDPDYDIDFMALKLESTLQKASSFYPLKKLAVIENSQPWMNQEILELTQKRSKSSTSKKRIKALNKRIQKKCKKAKNKWLDQKLDRRFAYGKPFFKVAKSILQPRKRIDLEKLDQTTAVEHFGNIASNNKCWLRVLDFSPQPNKVSTFSLFTTAKLHRIIKSIKSKLSTGPDLISIPFIKHLVPNKKLTEFMCLLLNKVVISGYWPDRWKRANLCLVPKKKNGGSSLSNLRPISLCCVLNKILEKNLVQILSNSFKNPCQFGFTNGISTDNAIANLDQILKSFRKNGFTFTACILADQSKAFDKLPWASLLDSLQMKFSGAALLLLWNFIIGWRFKLPESDFVHTASGVPQGSILGPALFKSFANRVTENKYQIKLKDTVSCHQLFADDDCLVIGCKSRIDLELAVYEGFSKFKEFENDWGISYNFEKFVVLSKFKQSFSVFGKAIDSSRTARYLGYFLDIGNCNIISDFHFNEQAKKVHSFLPQFIALRRILTTEQALLLLKTHIYPCFYGFCPVEHLLKKTLTYCNFILRKFTAAVYKCAVQFTKDVFINLETVLKVRFENFSCRAFRQQQIDVYNHKIFREQLELPLRRWSGYNRFSTPTSWLHICKFKEFSKRKLEWIDVKLGYESISKYRKKIFPKTN